MRPKALWSLAKEAFKSWSDDHAPSMGAALAYYTLFSIAPLLVIIIAVAGLFFGAQAVRGEVFGQLSGLMGDESAMAIQDMLARVSEPKQSGIATAIGVLVLLLGASSVFAELQSDMDRIWRVPDKAKPAGIWGMFRTRLLSFGMIVGLAFVLIVSLVVSAALSALGKWWGPYFGAWMILAHVLDVVVSFGLLTAIFALIYKTLPSIPVRWREMWVGAAVTALLFTVGKFLIGLYLGKSDVASGFGAAGSLVLVMVWVYYSAQIFLLGAEFTRVHSRTATSQQAKPAHPESAPTTKEVPDKPAANEPSPGRTPAQQLLVARRSVASTSEVVIRDGRVLIDPVGRGEESRRASRRLKVYAARRKVLRNRSLPAMGIAAAAGLLFGLFHKVKSIPGQSFAWPQPGHK